MSYSIIVATSSNGVIGANNSLIWDLPEDLKYFKEKTLHKTIIMGRKTHESIGRPLTQRINIVLTKDPTFTIRKGFVFHNIDDLLNYLPNDKEHMVIGGAEIYNAFLPHVDMIYHTLIEKEMEGDTYFHIPDNFKQIAASETYTGTLNGTEDFTYRFRILVREP